MNNQNSSRLLDWAFSDKVSAHVDLTDRVMKKATLSPTLKSLPRIKFATSLLIAVLALILLSTIAVAIYKLVTDPGLQAVQDAGLVTDFGNTTQPTLQHTIAPSKEPSALMVGQSQTVEGVSMILDWVYLDATHLLYGIQFSELPENIGVGFPSVLVNDQPVGKGQQESKYLQSNSSQSIYMSNQVLQPDAYGSKVKLDIEIPLVRYEKGKESQVAVFQFSLKDVPLNSGHTIGFQQTAAVSVNGVELQLRSFRQTSTKADAVLCPSTQSTEALAVNQASLQVEEAKEFIFSTVSPAEGYPPYCQQITFIPFMIEDGDSIHLTVNQDWSFYLERPTKEQIPGVVVGAPREDPKAIAVVSNDQVSMTLDWVFADTRRLGFGYTISGLPEIPDNALLGGMITVIDSKGYLVGYGAGGSSTLECNPEQIGTISGTWSTILQEPLTEDNINMSIDVTLDGTQGVDWNHIIGNINNPAINPAAESADSMPIVIPGDVVGTFHFNVDTKVFPETRLQPGLMQQSNEIIMELIEVEMTPSYSSFVLCYNKPSPQDWIIPGAILTTGLEQTSINGYELISDMDYSLKNIEALPPSSIDGDNVRCVRVDFLLGHSNQARTITLTIPTLERSMPEAFSQDELDAAYAILKERGIEMKFILSRGSGGGGGTWEYTQLPQGMSEEEAYDIFVAALGYREPGSWIFTFTIQP